VKVTLRFRGREMAHQELGTQLLNKVKEVLAPTRALNTTQSSRAADHHDFGPAEK